ncbi:hypothetical protein BC829DRAFT_37725 [Chytridium lagenaria]|nr:hypothetical protein BC829DRAFT_37725 [Chytridium lagenaria]
MDRSKPNLKGSKNEEKPVNSRSRSSVPSCPDLKDTSHQNVRKSVSFLGLNENPSQAGMKNAASPSLQHIYEENSDEDHEYGALRRDTLEKEASDGLHPMKRKTRQHVISQSINAKDHVEDLKDSSPNVSGLQSLRWKRQDSSRSPSHTEQQKSEAVFKSLLYLYHIPVDDDAGDGQIKENDTTSNGSDPTTNDSLTSVIMKVNLYLFLPSSQKLESALSTPEHPKSLACHAPRHHAFTERNNHIPRHSPRSRHKKGVEPNSIKDLMSFG